MRSAIIDIGTIQSIVADLSTGEEDLALETIQVIYISNILLFPKIYMLLLQLIDAFSSPRLTFDGIQKVYKL